jgi:hypothetical protein
MSTNLFYEPLGKWPRFQQNQILSSVFAEKVFWRYCQSPVNIRVPNRNATSIWSHLILWTFSWRGVRSVNFCEILSTLCKNYTQHDSVQSPSVSIPGTYQPDLIPRRYFQLGCDWAKVSNGFRSSLRVSVRVYTIPFKHWQSGLLINPNHHRRYSSMAISQPIWIDRVDHRSPCGFIDLFIYGCCLWSLLIVS